MCRLLLAVCLCATAACVQLGDKGSEVDDIPQKLANHAGPPGGDHCPNPPMKRFELLRDFVAVAQKTGFKWSLGFGSMLGAIRQDPPGFIPGDDDLDVIMPGKDLYKAYDAFAESKEGVLQIAENCCRFGFRLEHKDEPCAYLDIFAMSFDSNTYTGADPGPPHAGTNWEFPLTAGEKQMWEDSQKALWDGAPPGTGDTLAPTAPPTPPPATPPPTPSPTPAPTPAPTPEATPAPTPPVQPPQRMSPWSQERDPKHKDSHHAESWQDSEDSRRTKENTEHPQPHHVGHPTMHHGSFLLDESGDRKEAEAQAVWKWTGPTESWFPKFYLTSSEWGTLKKIKMYGLDVFLPHDGLPSLKRHYGEDAETKDLKGRDLREVASAAEPQLLTGGASGETTSAEEQTGPATTVSRKTKKHSSKLMDKLQQKGSKNTAIPFEELESASSHPGGFDVIHKHENY